MESIIRKDNTAKKVTKTKDDKKSTLLLLGTFFIVLILSAAFDIFSIGSFQNILGARIALAIMATGIIIIIYFLVTFSRFYTRTLVTINQLTLDKKGLYKVIQHPGYLGTILIWAPPGIPMQNNIIFTTASLMIPIAYYYRINNEEKMLVENFVDAYKQYQKQSWHLLSFLWKVNK